MGEVFSKISALSVLTTQKVMQIEAETVNTGVSFYTLMQSAGQAVFKEITQRYSLRPTLVLCGPGNNGGDGYVVATLLQKAGWPVTVATQSFTKQMSDFAMEHRSHYTGPVVDLTPKALLDYDLVVDGLFGTGLVRALSGGFAQIVERANESGKDCVAIDIPSGIHTDSGEVMGQAIRAQVTVTFSYRKPGHLLMPGRAHGGELVCRSIGLVSVPQDDIQLMVNRPEIWQSLVPHARLQDHKYSRGHLLVLAGSEMTGAGRLATAAARRIGAGMVTVACAPEAQMIYALSAPGLITKSMDRAHTFKQRLLEKPKSAVLLGPGNGVTEETRQAVLETLAAETPCVLDADALTVFQKDPQALFESIKGPCVLTPHAGEFKRLFDIAGDKVTQTRKAAQRSGAVVLYKGADTVIARPDGLTIIADNAPPTLATAGSGDVLAGMIAGLLAQGLPAFAAASMATWVHGEAAQSFGPGLIAEDLSQAVPKVLSTLARKSD